MTLKDHFEKSGNWLFRRRSYFPVLILAAALLGFRGMERREYDPSLNFLWEIFCLAIGLFGLSIRIITVGFTPRGTSGRITEKQKAESLNTTGIYSAVRHPLYLGNYFMWLSVAMLPQTWWVPVFTTLIFWIYYERIMFAEEEFLRGKFGEAFLIWAAQTPAFLPSFRKWKAPELPFSLRTVLRREPSGLLGLVAVFTLFAIVKNFISTDSVKIDLFWTVALSFTALIYVILVFLKKKTKLLHVPGR
ncbi:MAG: DUF1295 domain-containing protein [Nitrospirae bacterium]|nr:DUF1295 domain-containing protein [Nitrospirota bacterium]